MDQEPQPPLPPVSERTGPSANGQASANGDAAREGDGPRRSLAGRLFSTGGRGAQRFVDASGLDQAVEAAVEEALVRAIESEATENAIARVINGPLIEQAVSEAMASESVEKAIVDVLDSEMSERVWDRVLEGPHTQRLIERIAESPEVRSAIASQGIGLIGDLGHQVSRVTRILDFIGERLARKVLLRPERLEPTSRVGLFTRALGLAIDAVIVNFALVALGAVISAIGNGLGFWSGDVSPSIFAVGASLWLVASSVYLFVFWSLSGQTPGMRFLDIRVEQNGEPRIGPGSALRRLAGFWLSVALFGLGFLGTLIRIDRVGFHDRFGDTMVYFVDPVDPEHPHEHPVL